LRQSASISPLAWLGQPFAIAGTAMLGPAPFAIGRPAMLLQRTDACLLRALTVMFWLRVLIVSVSEQADSDRYRHGVRHLASCRLDGVIEA
jgi:hypothetical protein